MKKNKIFVIGPIPPPVYGMAVVNARVSEQLHGEGADFQIINLAAPNLDRGLFTRFRRLYTAASGLLRFCKQRGLRGQVLYMSVSGGLGQLYELLFLWLARMHRMSVVLHHHSFAYLVAHNHVTHALIKSAGPSCIHITLSSYMAEQLQTLYGTNRVVTISSAAFALGKEPAHFKLRQKPATLGFISNIAMEKGIFDFLDLMDAMQEEKLPLMAKIAGPFQDVQIEKMVCKFLGNLHNTEYVGPMYGRDKDNYFAGIDVLIFPTRYKNEAEPAIIHEAMSRGIPVIAYGRGCIPEILGSDSGLVVPPAEDFVSAALAQIHIWVDSPQKFQEASAMAAKRSATLYEENSACWEALKAKMIQGNLSHLF